MQKKKGRRPIIPQNFYLYDFASMAKKEKVAALRVKFLVLEQVILARLKSLTVTHI